MTDSLFAQFSKLNYPILFLNADDKFVWCNKKFINLHKSAFHKRTLVDKSILLSIIEQIDMDKYEVIHNEKVVYFNIIESSVKIENIDYKLLSFFDISKRYEFIKKLSEKQKMFEILSEYLPEGIVLYSEKIIYTNPSFEKLIGYSGRELLKTNFIDLFLPEAKVELENSLSELSLKQDKKYEIITKIVKKNLAYIDVEIKTRALSIDNTLHFLSIVTDVTKKIQNENKLTKIAYIDALTGIYNRRKFNELLKLEYTRVKRYGHDLSALFFDIDFFKKVNDNYGHDVGDDVLRVMSKLVMEHIRETDFFARWGGEEFIVLLPETDLDGAFYIAENIRKNIEDNIFDKVGKITISIGVTTYKSKEQIETFIKRLDNALYKAKHEGRNKVVSLV